jgi:diguanylate cyclase (GGDEF)-like protein
VYGGVDATWVSARAQRVTRVCGIAAALIGLLGVIGWHTGLIGLVTFFPSAPGMAYFTGVCVVLCGLGLLSHSFSWPRWITFLLGLLTLSVTAVWLLEHGLNIQIGVEEIESLLPKINGYPLIHASFATIACLSFFGIAILSLGLRLHRFTRRLIIWVCGALALAPFLAVLGGYITGFLSLYDWNAVHGMAINTLIAMVFLGTGLLAIQLADRRPIMEDPLLPLPVFLVLASVALLYWFALFTEHRTTVGRSATEAAKNLASNTLLSVDAPIRALDRMKKRWELGETNFEQWKADADAHISTEHLFLVLEWADHTWKVVWCRPETETARSIGFDIRMDPRWNAEPALKEAIETNSKVLSPTVDLRQGGKGIIAYLPLFPGGKFDGWLVGVIRLDELVKQVIGAANIEDENVSIFEGSNLIVGDPVSDKLRIRGEARADFHGHHWRFVVVPDLSIAAGHHLLGITLVLGLALAVALALVVHMFQRFAKAHRELARLANEDYLTRLLNRRAFADRMHSEVQRARRSRLPIAVIMSDVDFFKKFNDRYGHQEGDECLRQVAAKFKEGIRRPGDAVGRYGGEEFCAILPETDTAGAAHFAELLRESIERMAMPHELNPVGVVTASFGVASVDFSKEGTEDTTGATLIAKADAALYQAKESGRNRVAKADEVTIAPPPS